MVGAAEGDDEGCIVGEDDGGLVSITPSGCGADVVGAIVGEELGCPVGCIDGTPEGLALG